MTELERVELAAGAVRAARAEYRAAVLEAAAAGVSPAAIARAAGVSRQATADQLARWTSRTASSSAEAASSPTD